MVEKVSVIIPVYNAARTIERCVESLVANTYPSIEIILIDDCSKDDSLQICRNLADKYKNVAVYHNDQNSGVSYTRNVGLENASGHFLCFVDSDDWVEQNYVETLVTAIEEQNVSMAVCGFVNHDEKFNATTECYVPILPGKKEISGVSSVLMDLYHRRLLQQLWNKIFLADVIRENKISFDVSINMGEDFRFVLQYLHAVDSIDKVMLIGEPLYHYIRDNGNSLMSHFGKENIEEPFRNLWLMVRLLPGNDAQHEQVFMAEREKVVEQYTYRLVHDSSCSFKKKWRTYQTFRSQTGWKLFARTYLVLLKENLRKAF